MSNPKEFNVSISYSSDEHQVFVEGGVAYFDTTQDGDLKFAVYTDKEESVHVTFKRDSLQNFIDEFQSALVDPNESGKYRALRLPSDPL